MLKKQGRLLSPSLVIHKTNNTITKILKGDIKILRKIAAYVVESGGKRVRPLFLYYLGKSFALPDKTLIEWGALLEIVHAASLLHDDVIDGAEERRAKPTGAKLFGNKQIILGGDHLLASGLKYLNAMGNSHAMEIFTDAIQSLTTAELLQMQELYNARATRATHASIVDGKTAVLFRAAGALVAVLRGETDYFASETACLGLSLGRFFQERDDYLDYFDAERLQKKGLQDFFNGSVTPPLFTLFERVTEREKKEILSAWRLMQNHETEAVILNLMARYSVRDHVLAGLTLSQETVFAQLESLPQGAPRDRMLLEFKKILAVHST